MSSCGNAPLECPVTTGEGTIVGWALSAICEESCNFKKVEKWRLGRGI